MLEHLQESEDQFFEILVATAEMKEEEAMATTTVNYVRNYNVYKKIFYTQVLWYFLFCTIVCSL